MKRSILVLLMTLGAACPSAPAKAPEARPGPPLTPAKKLNVLLRDGTFATIDVPARQLVFDDTVNLVAGERVVIEGVVRNGHLVNLEEVKEVLHPERALEIEFTQTEDAPVPLMLLTIKKNPFDLTLHYRAGIQRLGSPRFSGTSIIPIGPGLVSFESWPDPITRIVLQGFELKDGG